MQILPSFELCSLSWSIWRCQAPSSLWLILLVLAFIILFVITSSAEALCVELSITVLAFELAIVLCVAPLCPVELHLLVGHHLLQPQKRRPLLLANFDNLLLFLAIIVNHGLIVIDTRNY